MNILFVNFDPIESCFNGNKIESISVIRPLSLFERILIKLPFVKKYLPSDFMINKGWENECRNKDVIILFDKLKKNKNVTQIIESVCTANTKLVFFYWNPYFHTLDDTSFSEKWMKFTFSKKDAKEHNISYIGTFFWDSLIPTQNLTYYKRMAFFVGLNKGRDRLLKEIKNVLKPLGIHTNFLLVDNLKRFFSKKYSKRISYKEVLDYVKDCSVIIDLVQEGQEGLTLRTMESLFFHKKMLTNNVNIVDYDLYNPHNIFVYGKDSIELLPNFLATEYKFNDYIEEKYKFSNWLQTLLDKIKD